jgi:hypothetical protein
VSSAGEDAGGERVKMPSDPNARSALFATGIVLIATSILWYGALGVYAHFPPPPQSVGVVIYLICSALASPSFLIMFLLRLPPLGDISIAIATVITWFFYFIVCRLYLHFRGRHRLLLSNEEDKSV